MQRLIDANALWELMRTYDDYQGAKGVHDLELIHRDSILFAIETAPTVDAVPLVKLKQILMQYFGIGSSCYTYELIRSKEAYEIGAMTIDDFTEWDEFQVDDLIEYIISKMDGKEQADADS